MRYRPTWLPAGLRERARMVPLGPGNPYDGPVRIWKRAGAEAGFDTGGSRLEFGAINVKDGVDQFGEFGTRVDINGRPGWLVGDGAKDKPYLHWLIDAQTVIFINDIGIDVDLLRIARSVQPDPAQLSVPLRLGWLPAGVAPFSATFACDSADNWRLDVSAHGDPPAGQPTGKESPVDPERWIYLRLGRATDAPGGGESIVVAGHPARVVETSEQVYVVVPLESGLILTVNAAGMVRADLVAVAGAVRIGPVPDLGWLGSA
jgi:hypothetical protein